MAISGFIQLKNYGGVRYPLPLTCTPQVVPPPPDPDPDPSGFVNILITPANWVPARNAYVALVALDPSIWVNFSQNCPGVGGPSASCSPAATQPGPKQDHLLFSWGTQGPNDPSVGLNSWLRATFGADIDFVLGTVAFETVADTPNLGPLAGPAWQDLSPTQGTGTMLVYERVFPPNQILSLQDVTQQQMALHASYRDADDTAVSATTRDWKVVVDQSATPSANTKYVQNGGIADFRMEADRTFFFTNSGIATANDPAAPTADRNEAIRLREDDTLSFQFYEEVWNNSTIIAQAVKAPDAYYGSFNVVIKPQ